MKPLSQAVVAVAMIAAGGFAWGRLDPAAGEKLAGWGAPAGLTALLTGGTTGPEAAADAGKAMGGAQKDGQGGGKPGGGAGTPVVTRIAESALLNDRITALGDGEALRSVSAVPLSSGVLTAVHVTSGEEVKAGNVLAELDSEAETIARDRAALAERTAREKVERLQQLVRSRTATEVQLSDARTELDNATLALRDAELTLQRRKVLAPISGRTGIIPVTQGDYVTTQTVVTTIDDRSGITVSFWLPERFLGGLETGHAVDALPLALPGERFPGKVTEVASRVDKASRTFEARAAIANANDRLRPGMSFKVELRFAGQTYTTVDPLAVQWGSDGSFVWRIEEGKANKVPVTIIQRNSDNVLVSGGISPGDAVVVEGVQNVRQGAPVIALNGPAAGRPQSGS